MTSTSWLRILVATGLLAMAGASAAADAPQLSPGLVHPGYEEPPRWFKESFLDLRDDIAEAARAGRRVMLYFYQDGCPYCAKLLKEDFGNAALAAKTRRHFDVIALNLFGDREVTDLAGAVTTEKAYAKSLRVQFTPTLLVFDEHGGTALRLNGYLPPGPFDAALDYASGKAGGAKSFAEYLRAREGAKEGARPAATAAPLDLSRRDGGDARPLLALFERKDCAACDELRADGFTRAEVAALLARFRMARIDVESGERLVTPAGAPSAMHDWSRSLGVAYTPSLVFFDTAGKEVFRVEGYVRPFHLASSLDYVASGAYREQPEFQRFIEARAEARRAKGERIELMR